MKKPLEGIRVLDLGQGVAAPYCGLLMAQYGAEVIKVEPLNGDWMRGLGKNWNGQTAYSISYNLGKKGIAVDLKKEKGINLILKIAKTCDVVLENFRPGVVDRLGIGFNDIKAVNDKVLYVSVSGFGQTGRYNDRPGSDGVLQAFSGLVSINKDKDGFPHRVGTTVIDSLTGLCTFQATSMALFGGVTKAQFLDISLLQSAGVLLMPNIADFYLSQGPAMALNPPAGTYKTKDGYICILPYTNKQWLNFFDIINKKNFKTDKRFSNIEARSRAINFLYKLIENNVKNKTNKQLCKLLKKNDIPHGVVNTLSSLKKDKHLKKVNFFRKVKHPSEGNLLIPDTGIKINNKSLPIRKHQPNLGENGKQILKEIGYGETEIKKILDLNKK